MKVKSLSKVIVLTSLVVGVLAGQTQASASLCKAAIAKHETQKGIPQGLLRAIAKIESGFSPWVVNSRGRGHVFHSKEAAAQYIKQLVQGGFTNFSVGVMQLHYASHRRNFTSVEEMLEPENNVAHAAKLIKNLEHRTGSMERAVKLYHSPSPAHHNPYQRRVYGVWAKLRGSLKPEPTMIKTVTFKREIPQAEIGQTKIASPQVHSTKIKLGIRGSTTKKKRI